METFLAGVRVLDLSHYIPGPLASQALADMGADVLKVEPPQGDGMRHLGPRDAQDRPLFYECINAGKSVLRLDLKREDGRVRFVDLVRDTDVLIEGFRPGVTERLGIGYAALHAINPGLVYCSISGYGATGPSVGRAGHDANYLAEAGVLDRNGSDRPVYFDPPVADVSGGLYAALAILGALMGRAHTGCGCHVDLGLADVIMPLQQFQVAHHGASGYAPKRGQTYLNGGAAYYNVYATADGGHVVVGAVEPKFWRAFCEAAGRPEWIERRDEPIPQSALIADLATYFAGLGSGDCDARFAGVDCCYSRVSTLGEALQSAHVAGRGRVRRAAGGALQALFPARIGGRPPAERAPLREVDGHAASDPWRRPRAARAIRSSR